MESVFVRAQWPGKRMTEVRERLESLYRGELLGAWMVAALSDRPFLCVDRSLDEGSEGKGHLGEHPLNYL